MKLSGNKRNGRYVQSGSKYEQETPARRSYDYDDDQRPPQSQGRYRQENQPRQENRQRQAGPSRQEGSPPRQQAVQSRAAEAQRLAAQRATQNAAGRPREGNGGRSAEDPRAARVAAQKKRRRRVLRVLTTVVLIALALTAVLYSVYKLGVKPPPMKPKTPVNPTSDAAAEDTSGTSPQAVSSDRKGVVYTFLILGVSGGNSDTMMVANFDVDSHKLSVVSIPRDTLVNVSWNTKKANSLYPNKGVDGVLDGVSKILGFQVDFYVLVDLQAFEELVDAVGGVDFDIPVDMDYDDDPGNLHIHFKKGPHHLNGQEAMEVVRFRHGYADQDIGRIGTQQDFLASAAAQILEQQDKLNLEELVSIFLKYVKTDLSAGNLVWLGKEFYKMDAENIKFQTLPANYGDTVNKLSYVTIYVDKWLEILNRDINPFKEDITAKDLSILTRDKNGKLYVTDGNWAGKKSWGGAAAPDRKSVV
jgi:LCP family protein required for cell wall assembly